METGEIPRIDLAFLSSLITYLLWSGFRWVVRMNWELPTWFPSFLTTCPLPLPAEILREELEITSEVVVAIVDAGEGLGCRFVGGRRGVVAGVLALAPKPEPGSIVTAECIVASVVVAIVSGGRRPGEG